jgi:hypothetical protein
LRAACEWFSLRAVPDSPLDPGQFGAEGTGGEPTSEAQALLANPNVRLDADGIADVTAGRIDPRIVAVLTTVSHSHAIAVGGLCTGHDRLTSGGAVSTHYHGRGADIAAVDGMPVGPASAPARELVSELSSLDASYRPDEVGTPWPISAPGHFTDGEHDDKIHVAFKRPIDPWWTPPA